MTGLPAQFQSEHRPARGALSLATVVCLVLLALMAFVQVAHAHPSDGDSSHCPLCVMMHTAAPVAIAAAAIVLVQVGQSAPQLATSPVTRRRPSRLFIRPPPAGC